MRRTTAVTSMALVAALGAGCATSGKSETRQADANAPATITYWSTGGDDETAIFEKAGTSAAPSTREPSWRAGCSRHCPRSRSS